MSSRSLQQAGRPTRPFGVWLATGYAILFTAFMPLFTHLWALTFPPNAGFDNITPLHLLLTAGISIVMTIIAVQAWRGHNRARIALLILVTLYYGLIAYENGIWLTANMNNADLVSMFFMRMARGIVVPAIFIWYFTEPEIKRFYQV